MASRDKLGSTISLQGGDEAIPREYHRKVLKKIAQLTKVIYALNTKNDEHEEFVQRLRSLHEAELQRLLADNSSQLERYREGAEREREVGERRERQLRERMGEVERERDQLLEKQVSYRKEVGECLGALKSEHTQQIQQFTQQLERLRNDHSCQLKEISGLREGFARKTNEQLRAMKSSYEKELGELSMKSKKEVQKLEAEVASLMVSHQKEQAGLKQQYHLELEAQKQNLAVMQRDILETEARKWEEKMESLQWQFSGREEQLKQQISTLSNDLRATRDKLALSEQRLKEVESHYKENKVDSSGLKEKLVGALGEVEELRGRVSSLHGELDMAKEQYKQQTQEMKTLSTTLSKLEALRVSHEGVIENLRSQISGLQQRISQLEEERESLLSSQRTSGEQQTTRIRALEKELDRVAREKQDLHAQYAREIEAAHAQLGQRETELGTEHFRELQELRDQHQNALKEVHAEKNSALEELRRQFKLEREGDTQSLIAEHTYEATQLRQVVTEKSLELQSALAELEGLRAAAVEREKELETTTRHVERLKGEVSQVLEELRRVQGRWEESKREGEQLKSSLESLQEAKKQATQEHQQEVVRVRTTLTQQLEQQWRERMKQECASLRAELSHRYSDDSHTALMELAGLKDGAMKEAHGRWEEERKRLVKKIDDLEHKLEELHHSTAVSLEEAKSTTEEQLSTLRRERARHREEKVEMGHAHQQQLLAQQQEFEGQRKCLTEELHSKHSVEVLSLQQAHQVAVRAFRDQLQQQGREELKLAAERYSKEMDAFRVELSSQHDRELTEVRQQHCSEVVRHRKQLQDLLEQRKKESNDYEHTIGGLHSEVGWRDSELSKLRDRVNNLTVTVSNLKKELGVKGQEVLMIRRETNNQIRLREQQLTAAHHIEVDSLSSQHRHQTQLLLSNFNRAKELLNEKISELEKQLAESERHYHSRDSRPEDLEAIRDLKAILREQEYKMKELIAEKRIYQLELMNREKNYNKIFSANPHVGVLDPLQFKLKKKVSESSAPRHASAPSLVSPSVESSAVVFPPTDSKRTQKEASQHSTSTAPRPRKLMTLHNSPLTQQKFSKNRPLASHSALLQPTPPSVSKTMLVQ